MKGQTHTRLVSHDGATEHRRDWFAVERRVFDDGMFAGDEFSRRDAWLWLIASAAKREHRTKTRGGIVELKRGEVIIGRDYLAKAWGWTASRVRTFLEQLRIADRLEYRQSNGHHPNVAKVLNYGRFQDFDVSSSPVEPPEDRQSVASGSPHPYKEQSTEDISRAPAKRDSRTRSRDAEWVEAAAALKDYNQAAAALGFRQCGTSTARLDTVLKRLRDIGHGDVSVGRERFREALQAIPHDPFLAGRVKPRDGRPPFRLTVERLLSTNSKMGDVLAALIDLFNDHGPARMTPEAPGEDRMGAVSDAWASAQDEELAAQRARWAGPEPTHEAPDAVL